MSNILIINAGQDFGHSSGEYNAKIAQTTLDYFTQKQDVQVRVTQISKGYRVEQEVENFVWADYIIYHTPIWWFQLPHGFKAYLDHVLTHGHNKGIYKSDGRRSANPDLNYGTGGLMHGKKYMVTTSWNAPKAAFTLENEFFDQTSVDKGVLFGFHKMNEFISMDRLPSFHFYDVHKNRNIELDMQEYTKHLNEVFAVLGIK